MCVLWSAIVNIIISYIVDFHSNKKGKFILLLQVGQVASLSTTPEADSDVEICKENVPIVRKADWHINHHITFIYIFKY